LMTVMVRGLAVFLASSIAGCQLVGGIDERHPTGKIMNPSEMVGSGGRSNAGATAPRKPLCQEYCSTVTRACTEEYAVYGNEAQCLAVCGLLEEGTASDGVGNTVGCRLNAARDISTEPADCRFAGPGGAGVCGDNCDSYCELMSHGCGTDDYKAYWLDDLEQCKRKCRGLPDLDLDGELESDDSRYSALNNNARDHDGDTVQCRLFHASVANTSVGGPAGHCWHAALAPRPDKNGAANPCARAAGQTAPRCKDYCRLNATACSGDAATYENDQQCMAVCNAFEPGMVTDDGSGGAAKSNTLGCRYTHTYNALTAAVPDIVALHCGHSGPSGAGVCGDDCVSYCSQLEKTCSSQFSSFGGAAKCQSECKALLGDAKGVSYSVKLAKSGTSPLACRMLGLARAMADAKVAPMACEVAVGRGECK
jgi:hypothetical protein